VRERLFFFKNLSPCLSAHFTLAIFDKTSIIEKPKPKMNIVFSFLTLKISLYSIARCFNLDSQATEKYWKKINKLCLSYKKNLKRFLGFELKNAKLHEYELWSCNLVLCLCIIKKLNPPNNDFWNAKFELSNSNPQFQAFP